MKTCYLIVICFSIISANSYLRRLEKNIKSHDSYSSHRKKGGGVILVLTKYWLHFEMDIVN